MTDTHCPYCALQCAQRLVGPGSADEPLGAAMLMAEPRDFPTNAGGMCQKGWTSTELLRAPDRLTSPLRRAADGGFVEVGWDEALDEIARAV